MPTPAEVVRYHPSQIKIEKRPGKRTASYFCGLPRRPAAATTPAIEHQEVKEEDSPPRTNATATRSDAGSSVNMSSSMAEDSDFSDNLSVVSDLSDLSVMTFGLSCLSDTSSNHRSRHRNALLAGVHGEPKRSVHRRRRERLQSASSSTNSRTCNQPQQRFFGLHSDSESYEKPYSLNTAQKAEFVRLKEDNFALRRENVNLRGQLESLQEQQRQSVLRDHMEAVENSNLQQQSSPDLLLLPQGVSAADSTRMQMRQAHDEIFRLKTEDTRMRMELRSLGAELEAQKDRSAKLSDECERTRLAREKAEAAVASLEESLSQLRTAKSGAEAQLEMAKGDLSRAIESRDWYCEQLKSAQEKRGVAQSEVVALQKESSAKKVAAAELEAEVKSWQLALDDERQKYKLEKEEFSAKLKRIEAEMTDQEAQLDQIQREKDAMIGELTARLAELEGEVGDVGSLSEGYKIVQEELDRLKETVQCKEEELTRSRTAVEQLENQKKAIQEAAEQAKENATEKNAAISRLEIDLQSRNKLLDGFKESITAKEEDYNMLLSEKESLDQSMEILLEEMEGHKTAKAKLTKQTEEQEKRIEQLEQEMLEQHQRLDDTEARATKLKEDVDKREEEREDLKRDLEKLDKEREELRSRCEIAETERDQMRKQLDTRPTPSPEPEVSALKDEIVTLKQSLLQLEQVENSMLALRDEYDELQEVKERLADKLMESEKVYDEEVEKLRELVLERDRLIECLRQDLEGVEADLKAAKQMLDDAAGDRERVDSEAGSKVEALSEALREFDSTKRRLSEKQASLTEAEEQTQSLREENEELATQIKKLHARIDLLEGENARLKHAVEDQIEADEECKGIQAQRIARLEGFVAEYESEVKDLLASNSDLQNQIILLEDANGKLQSECLLNGSLRDQVQQLQKDLKNDTSLRQDLARSIELAKLNLGDEISGLEERLREEREKHAAAREVAMRLEQENVGLQKELNAYLIKQGEASEEIRRLEATIKRKDSMPRPPVHQEIVDHSPKVKELEHILEEKRRSVCSLEDHISTLKFHLEQKATELEDARSLLRLNTEKSEAMVEQMRRSQESLRVDLAQQVQSAELLAEERNSYRAQVLEMNSALKNSLEHIRELRTRASDSPVFQMASPSPSVVNDPLADFLSRRSPSASGRNISSLQNCLASVKAEMMILQSKLAPRAESRASSSATAAPASGAESPANDSGEQEATN